MDSMWVQYERHSKGSEDLGPWKIDLLLSNNFAKIQARVLSYINEK